MKAIKVILSSIGFLLVSLILFMMASLANLGFMLIPFIVTFTIGCVLLLMGSLSGE